MATFHASRQGERPRHAEQFAAGGRPEGVRERPGSFKVYQLAGFWVLYPSDPGWSPGVPGRSSWRSGCTRRGQRRGVVVADHVAITSCTFLRNLTKASWPP